MTHTSRCIYVHLAGSCN